MEQLDVKQVQHIASLSRLALSPEEANRFASQLGDILDYASKLPDLHDHSTESHLHLAKDVAKPTKNPHELLKNAVSFENGYVKVPAILDKSES